MQRNTKNRLFFWLAGYLLILAGLWLPEAHWQLGGQVFSTTLATQWTGYALLAVGLLSVLWQSWRWWRQHRSSFWVSLLYGGYVAGFAGVKWYRLYSLQHDFQVIEAKTPMAVSGGAGLILLFAGGIILLVNGAMALPHKL